VKPFDYRQATDAGEAIATVARSPRASFLGGGTNLVDLMKLGVATPDLLVDVTRLPQLDAIEPTPDGGLRIGAGVRNSDLSADRHLRRGFPLVARALLSGASGQIRNMATVGGNLLQRTRCGYFQDVTKPCNKRVPGSGCPAPEGDHRNHAILGTSPSCIATHPSDLAVALVAVDAVVHVAEAGGERTVPLIDLYRLPGGTPERETDLAHGALITAIELPPLAFGRHSTYRKVRDRASFAFAVASVAAAVEVREQRVHDVRLALGAVAPKPWRALVAEEELRGGPATPEAFRAAIAAELDAAEPLPGNAFKLPLVSNLVTRTLSSLAGIDR